MKTFRSHFFKTLVWLFSFALIGICGHAQADLAAQVRLSQDKVSMQCPSIKQLTINPQTKIWTSPGGWKAFDKSFGTQIKSFAGAQWVGVKLGQVICIYKPVGTFTFPVFMYYNRQVVQPGTSPSDSGSWVQVKKNRINCVSNKLADCTFSPLISEKPADPDEEASQIKPGDSPKLPDSNL